MRILLCDDSMTVRKKIIQQLKSVIVCDVIEAKNGLIAVEAYKAHRPDFVFMDIMMPVKDGLTALTEIIELDPKARVIMLSSVGTKDNLQKALKAGALDFVQKPLDSENLTNIFQNYAEEG